MKIFYLTNAPVPKHRHTDAHFQELDLLVNRFGGDIMSTFPLARPNSFFPKSLYGIHNQRAIKLAAKQADIIHVFSPVLYPYPYLDYLRHKPIIYSALTPVSKIRSFNRVNQFVVYDEESQLTMERQGVKNVSVSPPFVDFKKTKLPHPSSPFTLLMASAPWEKNQFQTKGISMLIKLLGMIPELNIIFIWRDILFDEMQKMVQSSSHANRITLVNRRVNIQSYLEKCHAVVLLAQKASIVKSYPHSLMEGLLGGRPVITSATIPMSNMILQNNYGKVLTSFSLESLEEAVHGIKRDYNDHCTQLAALPADVFGKDGFLDFYDQLYQNPN